jgi:hypothetical protein
MPETNSYKKATDSPSVRALEVTDLDLVELRAACLARMAVLRQLISTTYDYESRQELLDRLSITTRLHDHVLRKSS